MRKLEAEINELKEKELEKLTRPCSAFVTLENEEGYNRAIMLNKISVDDRKNLAVFLPGVKPIDIKQASEPSDIIWENRMLKKRTRRRRKLVVALVMSACLLGSFILIFQGTKIQETISRQYPPVSECAVFYDRFKDDLLAYAIADWKRNHEYLK